MKGAEIAATIAANEEYRQIPKTNSQILATMRANLKFKNLEIPLPTKEFQNQTIEELDHYQKIIDGCRQVIKDYKPSINIDPSWEMFELGDILEIVRGGSPRPIHPFP